MRIYKVLLSFLVLFLLTNCSEVNTNDPQKAYQYWTKSNAEVPLQIINGQYWQSAHWSHECVLYLEIADGNHWWKNFMTENNLILDSVETQQMGFQEKPHWFLPAKSSVKYKENSNFDQGSRYFFDSISNKIYIYEIQL